MDNEKTAATKKRGKNKKPLAKVGDGYHYQKRLQRAMRGWVIAEGADYFVTLTFNRKSLSYNAARRLLKRWHASMDKSLLDKYYASAPAAERLEFTAFFEKPDTNPHWHLAVRLADKDRASIFEALAEKKWLKLVKSGTLDLQKINTDKDALVTAAYKTKDLWKQRSYEDATFSSEFLPHHIAGHTVRSK